MHSAYIQWNMDTLFVSLENSKPFDPHRLKLNLSDK